MVEPLQTLLIVRLVRISADSQLRARLILPAIYLNFFYNINIFLKLTDARENEKNDCTLDPKVWATVSMAGVLE